MKSIFKRSVSIMLALVMIVSVLVAGSTFTASAGSTYSQAYTFGEEYKGTIKGNHSQFHFSLSQKSHIYIFLTMTNNNGIDINVYSSDGNLVSDNRNTLVISNDAGTARTEAHSCNLTSGSYYIDTYGWAYNNDYYTLTAWAEPVVSLSTPTITDISSPAGGKFKVSYTEVKNALKYEIQYSKNDNFSSAKKGSTPAKSFTASGLTKGTYYYARVRAYTVYNDGLKVYSNWSRAQAVYVKKLANRVDILTGSKKLKYTSLKKKNASFIVAANDLANAKFTYALSSVPSNAKKYVSINKTSGKVTVKKGLKKGTYNVAVTVSAAATGSYNKASAKKTVKIIVQ